MYLNPFHVDDITNKSFLVTGGAGFIGSNIVEYLLKYKAGRVVVLDNLSTGFKGNISSFLASPDFQFIQGDILDSSICTMACKGIDYVIHQAALGSVPRSIENPLATHNVNATGFINVLIAARDSGVKRVVYASSSSVYGDSIELPKKEERIGKPLSPYAVSKLTNELYADVFSRTYGMELIGLRYFNIFGPRQNPKGEYAAAIPLFMQAIINNLSPYINGDGEQTRDFTFVENAVQANIKALFASNPNALNNIFNVAVSERISINQLFEILKQIAQSELKPIYRETRKGDVRNSLADISKANELMGYEPKVKTEEGLKITFEWFKKSFKTT